MRNFKIIIILGLMLVACNSKIDFSENLESTSEMEITPTTLVPSAQPATPTPAPKEPELMGVYGAGVIASATRSPDGKILVYLENSKTLHWVDTETWEEIGSRDMSGLLGIDSLIFSPDGSHLLLDDSYKPIVINLETGEKITTIMGEKNERGFAFSNDNRYVVFEDYWFGSGSGGGNIALWDTVTDQLIRQFPSTDIIITPNAYMTYPVISPDDQIVAAGCFDQQVYIWDLHTGETLRTLEGRSSKITSVGFSPDGMTLAVAYSQGDVDLWNTKTWERFKSIAGFREEYIEGIEFSLDSEYLVVNYQSSSLYQTWNRATGEIQDIYIRDLDQEPFLLKKYSQGYTSEYFYHGKKSPRISFSPDGRNILTRGDNILLWDIDSGDLIASLEGEGPDFIFGWKYSPDGLMIGTISYYAGIRIWDAKTGELISNRVGTWGFDTPDRFVFLGDTNLLALFRRDEDSTVEIWDYVSNQQVASLPIGDHHAVEWLTGMSYSDEKRELEVTLHSEDQRVVQTWDLENYSFIRQEIVNENIPSPDNCYGQLSSIECVSPDGKIVAKVNLGKIQIFEEATSTLVYTSSEVFTDYTNTRAGITFSPDSRLLAFSNIDGKVTIWNIEPLFEEVVE